MTHDEIAAFENYLGSRMARLRRNRRWLAAAVVCFLGFAALIFLMIWRGWFAWWLFAVAVAFELATFVCLGNVTLVAATRRCTVHDQTYTAACPDCRAGEDAERAS